MASASAGWRFDNSYARLPAPLFSRLAPAPVREPRFVVLNDALAAALGLDPAALGESPEVLAGNALPPGAEPLAQAYAGHQYGHFVNLGDGRAILLGEQIGPDGRRHDIQLKGSGRTPYSRQGDGRAALGPMLREYVIGEAMHALGIPTTRALAVVATGEPVYRETVLPGAVLTRVAASHVRVGTFQFAAALGDEALVGTLLDHCIARHDPELAAAPERALAFLDAVVGRQAELVARWLAVGFVHGVMNTDNCAVSGETIDYGPCAFLDVYDPATVFSSIDHHGRYAFGNQPAITQWNLARLAESLLGHVGDGGEGAVDAARGVLATFPIRFRGSFLATMRPKLGLITAEEGDGALVDGFLAALAEARADYTQSLATLSDRLAGGSSPAATPALDAWEASWRARLARQPQPPTAVVALLQRSNPHVIPRNHLVEEALAAAAGGDVAPLERLVAAVRQPFMAAPDNARYRQPPPAGGDCYRTFCGT